MMEANLKLVDVVVELLDARTSIQCQSYAPAADRQQAENRGPEQTDMADPDRPDWHII